MIMFLSFWRSGVALTSGRFEKNGQISAAVTWRFNKTIIPFALVVYQIGYLPSRTLYPTCTHGIMVKLDKQCRVCEEA